MNNTRINPLQKIIFKIGYFVGKNTVLCIAFLAAVVTSVIVPPDSVYAGYFDWKTLTCQLCTLAVVCALKNVRFFTILAQKIVKTAKNTRLAILAIVYITFIGSMLIANDMALLTFLPLGYYALSSTHKEKYMAFCFIMQNIAANLGGMLTPFGNPQNLYLYTKFNIPNDEFVRIMLITFAVSIALVTLCCLFVKKEELIITERDEKPLPPLKTTLYLVLFALTILIVFRVIWFPIGLAIIIPIIFVIDRNALKKVDYALLLTFVCFFIFAGNMARIDAVQAFFSEMLNKNTLLVSTLCCQVISNVPSAILLSQFTENYPALLVGVNVGGVGTLIASLASLITFREYTKHFKGQTLKYIGLFSAFNFGFLIILTIMMMFIL